jgi:hypothetical protein
METRVQIGADRQHQHATAVDRPLSPEQLTASILRSTGILHSYIANELVELNKTAELGPDATEEQKRVRDKQALRGAIDKLQGYFDIFSNLYASGVGQTSDDFFASPDQALYLANGGAVFPWSGPNGSNIASQLLQMNDPQSVAKKLYEGLLSRTPTPLEEQFIVEQYTAAGEQRPGVIQELVWGILAGAEYRLYP